jgi:DNA-binding response OmpR family regulator
LYVVPAAAVEELPARGVPVIAWGPEGLMRSAFLAGCDDFLRDPWTPEELALRAAAVLSRARRRHLLPWGEVSWEGKDLRTPEGIVDLTIHESRILRALLRARGEPVSRAALAYAMQGAPGPDRGRAIDVHVAAVRKKVRARVPGAGRLIIGVRGLGYMIP